MNNFDDPTIGALDSSELAAVTGGAGLTGTIASVVDPILGKGTTATVVEYGRPAANAASGTLNYIIGGQAGQDFTRLAQSGVDTVNGGVSTVVGGVQGAYEWCASWFR